MVPEPGAEKDIVPINLGEKHRVLERGASRIR